ncbi:MAG: EFR1 family ferrodoxin [Bacteroidaceae bacterium]|nr:EFR1 family ferrodoxin [Bacteroidaceae bacterium]
MILWYSGCGNSHFVAEQLSQKLSDNNMVFIPDAAREDKALEFAKDEILGIVFPVYSWSVPKLVSEFLRTVRFIGKPSYVYAACTCGDETGLTVRHLRRDLARQHLTLDAFFSFRMPETYINLPGFKLDPPEKAQLKIETTRTQIDETVKLIKEHASGNFDKLKGGSSFLKSNILKPLFYGLLITDRKFNVSDACINCGICARNCPLHNITMENGRPHWNGHCTNCMSCYHRCPKNAINFGKASIGKGQYYFKQGE